MYDATYDLSYLDNVFSETLRLYPSAPWTNRLCNKDCVINGVSIKAGMQVFIPIYDVHRDPEVWPEPEKFIPERWVLEVLKLYS
jgi:cytochrome P450